MEFRRNQDDGIGLPVSLGYTAAPIRASAFSKPLLPSSSSFASPTPSRNGIDPTAPEANSPLVDHRSHAMRSEPPPPVPISSEMGRSPIAASVPPSRSSPAPPEARYRECLRNHAAGLGGHVLDGCGEFMPGGGDDPLKCAACSCHRSFHRKETDGDHHGRGRLPLLLPPPPLHHHHHHHPLQTQIPAGYGGNYSGSGGATTESSSEEHPGAAPRAPPGAASRKRFRTKFTAEQKERMLGFAERVGWRMQKQDEALVEQFCAEVGVRRNVLKVWMHNNKHIVKRQQLEQQQQLQLQQQPQQPQEEPQLKQEDHQPHQLPPQQQHQQQHQQHQQHQQQQRL